jgi:hypothetical protein
MAILNKETFLNRIKERIGEDTSDEAISFMEDMTDTFNELESKATNADKEDWKSKYIENDKMWREKYKSRFFDTSDSPEEPPAPEESDEKSDEEKRAEEITIDDLFEEKE